MPKMRKLVALSDTEAFVITSALSHWAYHCSKTLSNCDTCNIESILDDLDVCDQLRKKLNSTFDFSNQYRMEVKIK